MGSNHDDNDPGYTSADFSGFSMDLRIFLSQPTNPNQTYLLIGLGSYSIEEYDPFLAADTELEGSGWNFGAGLEHYFNDRTALNFGFVYRIIRYDEFVIGQEVFELDREENGNTFTLEAGIVHYF